jgi:exosortase A-associated hydrolase 2
VPLPEPFYLSLQRGRRFCVRYSPNGASKGALLFVHAFAEEMNKSRRMVAMQSRALAERGFSVLLLDLYGCGDSDGDFGHADWKQWRDDVVDVGRWWRAECGHEPVLWGMRVGCLVACEAAQALGTAQFLFWQPVITGAQALQQFLRLRVAQRALAASTRPQAKTEDLRRAFAQGETVEVAGYELAPGLALGLDASTLSLPPKATHVAWMEVVPDAATAARPAATTRIGEWRSASVNATLHPVHGPSFWQTQEIAECQTLVDETSDVLGSW